MAIDNLKFHFNLDFFLIFNFWRNFTPKKKAVANHQHLKGRVARMNQHLHWYTFTFLSEVS
jgi:hypothetical protein